MDNNAFVPRITLKSLRRQCLVIEKVRKGRGGEPYDEDQKKELLNPAKNSLEAIELLFSLVYAELDADNLGYDTGLAYRSMITKRYIGFFSALEYLESLYDLDSYNLGGNCSFADIAEAADSPEAARKEHAKVLRRNNPWRGFLDGVNILISELNNSPDKLILYDYIFGLVENEKARKLTGVLIYVVLRGEDEEKAKLIKQYLEKWSISMDDRESNNLSSEYSRLIRDADGIENADIIDSLYAKDMAKTSGCFIATAVYEDYDHFIVRTLRYFRDQHLQRYALGRAFIKNYYKYGVYIAKWIDNNNPLKCIVKYIVVLPAYYLAKMINRW